jgi:hypothetical protein
MDVARELGCGWHTVMDAVVAIGEQLIDHPDRIGEVTALGLDETLFARIGQFRTQSWSTQIVDVRRGQLLDVVEGRTATEPCRWIADRDQAWLDRIEWATLDLSASYRSVSTRCFRTPPKSPIPSTSTSSPTGPSMNAADASRTKHADIVATAMTRSTGRDGASRSHANDSPASSTIVCSVCCVLATRDRRCGSRGTRTNRPSGVGVKGLLVVVRFFGVAEGGVRGC